MLDTATLDLLAAARERDELRAGMTRDQNAVHALAALHELTETDQNKCGGKLLLKDTRFTVGQLIAEIASGQSVDEVCVDYDLDLGQVQDVLHALAVSIELLPHPHVAGCPTARAVEAEHREGTTDA